jgi:hypothetical protein
VWPAITFKPAPVRTPVSSSTEPGAAPAPSVTGSADGDDWGGAQAAVASAPNGDDDAGPPLDQLESQMQAEVSGGNARPSKSTARPVQEEPEKAPAVLPALDSLVERIPAEVKETLEELFRVRFQAVRQIPRKALVRAPGKPPAI